MMEARLIVMALVCLCIAQVAFAVEPPSQFKSIKDQLRFEKLIKETRCVVCQNQSLFESSSALASDMRMQISTMINAGISNHQIRNYLRNRYGDAILFLPPWRVGTLALWLGPIFMLLIAAFSFKRLVMRTKDLAVA